MGPPRRGSATRPRFAPRAPLIPAASPRCMTPRSAAWPR